jgi:hypothetical protein
MLLLAITAAIHTDTHFRATKNVLLEATYHPDMWDTKNWAKQQKVGPNNIFLIFVSVLRLALTVHIFLFIHEYISFQTVIIFTPIILQKFFSYYFMQLVGVTEWFLCLHHHQMLLTHNVFESKMISYPQLIILK